MGKENHAIFLNCKTLDYELVPVELSKHGIKIVVSNTNKSVRSLRLSITRDARSARQDSRYFKNIYRAPTVLAI